MGEVLLESTPQVATQWLFASVQIQCLGKFKFEHFRGMSWTQCISVSTSTFTVVQSIIRFVVSSRRKQFISDRYPTAASVIPLALFILTGFGAATTQFRWDHETGWAGPVFKLINIGNFILVVYVLRLPCLPHLYWGVIRTVSHFLASSGAVCCIVHDLIFDNRSLRNDLENLNAFSIFYLSFICCVVHLFLGALILPSKEWAAKMFSPIVFGFIKILRMMAVCFCPVKWHSEMNDFLDEVLQVSDEDMTKSEGATKATLQLKRNEDATL